MPSHGEIGHIQRRPSTPGANTNILYNKGGVDGADSNLTYDYINNSLNVTGNIVATKIVAPTINANTINVTQIIGGNTIHINTDVGSNTNVTIGSNGSNYIVITNAASVNVVATLNVLSMLTTNGYFSARGGFPVRWY